MKKKLLGLAAVAAFTTGFAATSAIADPSAKFAANWADNDVTIATIQVGPCYVDCSASDINANVQAAELMARLKVPQNKEVLIGVSGEASLMTFTEAKGKNGAGEVTSSAEATINMKVRLASANYEATDGACVDPTDGDTLIEAAPGEVTLASRIQTLAVDVANFANIDDVTVGYIKVALALDTVAAHHFNFVAYDLTQDEYDIYACFGGQALASVVLENGNVDMSGGAGSASATAVIQKRMLTAQQVRATSNAFAE